MNKHKQKHFFAEKDVLVSVPTGAGKSLTFELAPFALDYMQDGGKKRIILVHVVVPLVLLMKCQVYAKGQVYAKPWHCLGPRMLETTAATNS